MRTPKISVVIPAHNSQRTIERCINSVLSQTSKVFEIIVVDNNCVDGTVDILKSMSISNLRIVTEGKEGASYARNKGISESKGDYIAFLDSDDVWIQNKLEKQIKTLERNRADVVFCRSQKSRSVKKVVTERLVTFNELLCGNLITTSSVLVKRKLFSDYCFRFCVDSKFGEDWGMWLKLASMANIYLIDKPLVHYTIEESPKKYSNDIKKRGIINSFNDVKKNLRCPRMKRRLQFARALYFLKIFGDTLNRKQKRKYHLAVLYQAFNNRHFFVSALKLFVLLKV